MDRQPGEAVVDGLVHSPGISSAASPGRLPVAPDKGRVLLLGDVDVEARVGRPHDVAGPRVQHDVGGVQAAHSDQADPVPAAAQTGSDTVHVCPRFLTSSDLLFVSVKGGKGEALALVFPEEFALLQADVVHLVGRAASVGLVPLVGRARAALPVTQSGIDRP